jgi:adenylate cyclase class IV
MIEIEKKVLLEEEHLDHLQAISRLLSTTSFRDTYFDTPDYRLTKEDQWLRQREGKFELKVGPKERRNIDRYEEIIEESEIFNRRNLEKGGSLADSLKKAGIAPFSSFVTNRKKYQCGLFAIDIDTADFGDSFYHVAEVEVMVATEKEIPEAEAKIGTFLNYMGLDAHSQIPAKLTVYLKRKRPDHYQALVSKGIL